MLSEKSLESLGHPHFLFNRVQRSEEGHSGPLFLIPLSYAESDYLLSQLETKEVVTSVRYEKGVNGLPTVTFSPSTDSKGRTSSESQCYVSFLSIGGRWVGCSFSFVLIMDKYV